MKLTNKDIQNLLAHKQNIFVTLSPEEADEVNGQIYRHLSSKEHSYETEWVSADPEFKHQIPDFKVKEGCQIMNKQDHSVWMVDKCTEDNIEISGKSHTSEKEIRRFLYARGEVTTNEGDLVAKQFPFAVTYAIPFVLFNHIVDTIGAEINFTLVFSESLRKSGLIDWLN